MGTTRSREESEERVFETLREWLPELTSSESKIEIRGVSEEERDSHDGAHFQVSRGGPRTFACSRGRRRPAPDADAAENGMGT